MDNNYPATFWTPEKRLALAMFRKMDAQTQDSFLKLAKAMLAAQEEQQETDSTQEGK